MNSIDTNRSNFFPASKTADTANAKKLKQTVLKRNSESRRKELEAFAKSDSKVSIGSAVKDFARIKKAVDAAPDVDNTDKIAKLKQQIQQGTYKVNYEALADKVLASEF